MMLTLAGIERKRLWIPEPFGVTEIGAWRDNTAKVNGEAQAIVWIGNTSFNVREDFDTIVKKFK